MRGFQWLDGSFVEDKEPKDLDIVTFIRRPGTAATAQLLGALMQTSIGVFDRALIKTTYSLDAFFVDMDGDPESVVNQTRYWLGLFSHCRDTAMWKGMLEVRLEDTIDDAAAVSALKAADDAVAMAATGAVARGEAWMDADVDPMMQS